jgi:hypothetical protein
MGEERGNTALTPDPLAGDRCKHLLQEFSNHFSISTDGF